MRAAVYPSELWVRRPRALREFLVYDQALPHRNIAKGGYGEGGSLFKPLIRPYPWVILGLSWDSPPPPIAPPKIP